MQDIKYQENNRNALKIIVFDGKTKISTVEIDLRYLEFDMQ